MRRSSLRFNKLLCDMNHELKKERNKRATVCNENVKLK